jgi:uncharacterized BrkB/YihY/UPF0761 family membrane protein
MLWMCGIAMPTFTTGALIASGPLVTFFAALAGAPLVVGMLAYVWFMFKDPDRLQSEPFRIEQQWVQAQLGDNTTKQVITVDAERSALTANTAISDVGGEHG